MDITNHPTFVVDGWHVVILLIAIVVALCALDPKN